MLPLTNQGDSITQNEPIVFRSRGSRIVPITGDVVIYENLYRSYTETKPHKRLTASKSFIKQHSTKNETMTLVLQTESQNVGQLELNFSGISRDRFKHKLYRGKMFAKLKYEVQLIFNEVRLAYRLIVPEFGRWWNWVDKLELLDPARMSDRHWDNNFHEAEAIMTNVAAAFDVSGMYFSRFLCDVF